ncbi:MAG: alkaline phosphatase [Pirellulales bacterium]|nr:alkaline phosphatase [Pirellulales bacterium]
MGLKRRCFHLALATLATCAATAHADDFVKQMQAEAMSTGHATWGHWGADPAKYTAWAQHSNRLIPIYTFGLTLDAVRGEHSPYRDAARIEKLYGYLPDGTLNPAAEYFDQTDVYHLQKQAIAAGKKRVIVMVFDGMDWQTTRNAAIYYSGRVAYNEGRGTGLAFQDYRGVTTDYGYFVTSPHNEGTLADVNAQTLLNPGGKLRGGYDAMLAGDAPWSTPSDVEYAISKSAARMHAFTDSSSSATSLFAGIKTANDAVNTDAAGKPVEPLAWELQRDGWAIGVVTSVPISHATPAATYAINVNRDDFQDLTRDLIGRPSISHPNEPLAGVDVLLGGGWGEIKLVDAAQGDNFVAGNQYLAADDLAAVDHANGGRYTVVQRTSGVPGNRALADAARQSLVEGTRLLGLFGVRYGHLPFRTADGNYDPVPGTKRQKEQYSDADKTENPDLATMAVAALDVLAADAEGFWLMVEAGDVDWANHDDNIDNSIGAVYSGDKAFRAVTSWIETHGGWDDTALIVTADHGHYFFLTQPEALLGPNAPSANP